jgi:hypothetical protein
LARHWPLRFRPIAPDDSRKSPPLKITRLKTAIAEGNFDWTFVRFMPRTYPSGTIWSMDLPKPMIQNGFITILEKPAMGVTLNEEVARRHARKGGPFFE